jgi:signal transduction histidine kinase
METHAESLRLSRGEGIAGRVWESGRPIWVTDLEASPVFAQKIVATAANLRSAVAIPIANGDDFIGVLQLFSTELREADAEVIGKLQAIGSQIGEYVARMRAEAEADRLKSEFFALVSHELRTPLTSILGYLELVLEEPESLDEETSHFLGIVQRNGRRLLRLVDDLLFVAHVEAGEIALDPGTVELTSVVAEALEAAKPRAADKGIALRLDVQRVPASPGDAGRLGQTVDNLISNALKFTDAGGRVDVKLMRDGDEAVIAVRDTGMGIPAEEQSRLFDRFFRSERAAAQAVPGVGLGLTIVKAIVEGHGGRVEVDSEVGVGTTFKVRLPLSANKAGIPSSSAKGEASHSTEVVG